jgi:hypothetical protein
MKKSLILFVVLVVGLLAACGGGGGGGGSSTTSSGNDADSETPTTPVATVFPSIDAQLLDAPPLAINEANAQVDVLEEVVFSLRLLREFSFIFTAPLISNAIHGIAFETLSKTFIAAHCHYDWMDNDNSSSLTEGDIVNVDFLDCPDSQRLEGTGTGIVEVTISKVVNDGAEAIVESVVEFKDFTYTSTNNIAINVIGEVIVKSENSAGTVNTGILNEITSNPGKAVQFQVGADKLILVDPIYRNEGFISGDPEQLTLGASKVADSTLGATYSCPRASLSRADYLSYPQSGVLIQCEGNNSMAALQVSFFEFELADLVVNSNTTSVRWDDVAGFLFGESLGL